MRSVTTTATSTYLRVRTQGTRVSWVAKHTGLGKAKASENQREPPPTSRKSRRIVLLSSFDLLVIFDPRSPPIS